MAIKLTVSQPAPVSLSYVEAAIKPEVTGHVTPTYEEQTVYPAVGTTFGRVDVDAIPDPTAIKEIDSNGDHDVRRYGVARVNVPIPPGYVRPSGSLDITENADGIDVTDKASVNVNVPIPPGYIMPTGTKVITENGTVDVSQFSEAEVNVSSDPEIGFVLEGWDEKGQPTTLRLCGFTDPPQWYFYPFAGEAVDNSRGYFCNRLTTVILNEGIVRIWYYVFRNMKTIQRVVFPSTIRTIQGWAFYGDNALSELDFSLATEIPTLDNPGQLKHATGCVIKVPSSLLSAWQSATNWNALTNVVWEGV